MEGRVKARQPGNLPNSLGRQVGVLPITGATKPKRSLSDKRLSTGIGGTDIDPESFSKHPPSGASGHRSASKSSLQSTAPIPPVGSSRNKGRRLLQQPESTKSNESILSSPSTDSIRSLPPSHTSGNSRSGKYRTSPSQSKLSLGSSRKSPASSGRSKQSPVSKNTSPQSLRLDDFDDHADDEDNGEGQDIFFLDVTSDRSRPGSKVRSGSFSTPGSASQRTQQNGRKPSKTIDPEEVLAMNMEADFNKIYEINLHASEITHIDNLEKFKKLKVLDLSCNFIEQSFNLEFCKDLKELKLYDNRLRKIEGLENLKDLNSLQLQHNKIKAIGKGLGGLKKLKSLRIDCNQLLRIETPELSQCVQLTVIDVSYNMLDSLTALSYLPNLEEVNASGNRIKTVSDLSKCKHLQELDLSHNRITDLSGLRGLPKLMTLNLSHNQLTSFKTIGRLKYLQDMIAGNNKIYSLSTVATQLPALEVLDVTNNEITEWDQFYNLELMSELVELFISGNPFCAEDGPMPHYHTAIQTILPDLQIIDGAHIKKLVTKGAPLMRPMTASTIVSLRQMDSQMRSADEQMSSLEKSLQEKFASLRATCDSLPAEAPSARSLFGVESRLSTPGSRCSSRSRIFEAKRFAASTNHHQ